MRARYLGLHAATDPQGRAIALRFDIENRGREPWRAGGGIHIGWQVFDPETSTFITEGTWSPLDVNVPPGGTQHVETQVTLPEQDGPYRVYLSLLDEKNGWFYTHGDPLVLLEATVAVASPLAGKMLKEIPFPSGALVVSITRDEGTVFPRGDTELQAGDRVMLVTDARNERAVRTFLETQTAA